MKRVSRDEAEAFIVQRSRERKLRHEHDYRIQPRTPGDYANEERYVCEGKGTCDAKFQRVYREV